MTGLYVAGIQVGDGDLALLLCENDGRRLLPVWTSIVGAAAIAVTLEQEQFAKPLARDLLTEAFAQLTGKSQPQLTIRSIGDGAFYAEIAVGGMIFDAGPSNVVAVVAQRGWSAHYPAELLDRVRILDEITHVDKVGKFRELLDRVQPENF